MELGFTWIKTIILKRGLSLSLLMCTKELGKMTRSMEKEATIGKTAVSS